MLKKALFLVPYWNNSGKKSSFEYIPSLSLSLFLNGFHNLRLICSHSSNWTPECIHKLLWGTISQYLQIKLGRCKLWKATEKRIMYTTFKLPKLFNRDLKQASQPATSHVKLRVILCTVWIMVLWKMFTLLYGIAILYRNVAFIQYCFEFSFEFRDVQVCLL